MTRKRWLAWSLLAALGTIVYWQAARGSDAGPPRATPGDASRIVRHEPGPAAPTPASLPVVTTAPREALTPSAAEGVSPASSAPEDLLRTVGEAVRITARIVNADGAPLPGAHAWWLPSGPTLTAAGLPQEPWEEDGMVMHPLFNAGLPAAGLACLPGAVADADGRVALDARHVVVDDESKGRSAAGLPRPILLVARDGFTTRMAPVGKLKGGERDLGDIALEPEGIVSGRTVDESGRPLPGVRIRLWMQVIQAASVKDYPRTRLAFVPELMAQTTAADGRFMLRGLWQGHAWIELKLPDHVRQQREIQPVSGQTLDLGDVPVPAGSFVAGRVVDIDDLPVAGAQVSVVDGDIRSRAYYDLIVGYEDGEDTIHDELEQAIRNVSHDPVMTDAHGAFRIGGIDSPKVSVYATADGFEPGRVRSVVAGTDSAPVVMLREATLQVTIVDQVTHAPIPGTTLRALRGAHTSVSLPVTEAPPGTFVVRGVGPRGDTLDACAPGHAAVTVTAPGVQPAQSGRLSIELVPESVLAGRVKDAAGQPVTTAVVELFKSGKRRQPFCQAPVDGQGAFRIEHLGQDDFDLVASAHGFPDTALQHFTLAEGEHHEDLDLRLPAPARIHGTIFRADGAPQPNGVVRIDVPPYGEFKYENQRSDFVNWVRISDKGEYAFEALEPGEYKVQANSSVAVVCTLAEGEQRVLDFHESAAVHVHGRVTSAGKPAVGVPVTAEKVASSDGGKLGWVQPVLTDADGAYALELRGSGDLEIYAKPKGGREGEHHAIHASPGQDVVVDIAMPVGHIAGRVIDDMTGAPVPRLEIQLNCRGNVSAAYCDTDDEGRFRLAFLAPDTYRLRLDGRGQSGKGFAYLPMVKALEPRDIVLAEGDVIDDLQLKVCHGATLAGAVRLADGAGVQNGVYVQLVRMDHGQIVPGKSSVFSFGGDEGDDMRLEESDNPIWDDAHTDGGRYEFLALPAGEYRVLAGEATPEEVRDRGQPVILGEHEAATLDLVAR